MQPTLKKLFRIDTISLETLNAFGGEETILTFPKLCLTFPCEQKGKYRFHQSKFKYPKEILVDPLKKISISIFLKLKVENLQSNDLSLNVLEFERYYLFEKYKWVISLHKCKDGYVQLFSKNVYFFNENELVDLISGKSVIKSDKKYTVIEHQQV